MTEPQIGALYRFVPSAFTEFKDQGRGHSLPVAVTGRIVYINRRTRFFDVAFELHGVTLRESFKF